MNPTPTPPDAATPLVPQDRDAIEAVALGLFRSRVLARARGPVSRNAARKVAIHAFTAAEEFIRERDARRQRKESP